MSSSAYTHSACSAPHTWLNYWAKNGIRPLDVRIPEHTAPTTTVYNWQQAQQQSARLPHPLVSSELNGHHSPCAHHGSRSVLLQTSPWTASYSMIHSFPNAIDYVNATSTMLWWSRTDTSTSPNGRPIVNNSSSSRATGALIRLI